MAAIRSTEGRKKAKKDKKKAKKGAIDDDEDENVDGDDAGEDVVPKSAPVQMTAEDFADEEFGPSKPKAKGKKGKKQKGGAQPGIDDDDDYLNEQIKSLSVKEEPKESKDEPVEEEKEKPSAPARVETPAVDAAGEDGEAKGVLSKKEKERLKKEKEKVSYIITCVVT